MKGITYEPSIAVYSQREMSDDFREPEHPARLGAEWTYSGLFG